MKLSGLLTAILFIVVTPYAFSQDEPATSHTGAPAEERVYIDPEGVIRWTGSAKEVALFGANYCLPSACDFRAARYFTDDLKSQVRTDMAHFVRMGWDGLRVCLWGDFQNSDSLGNLVNNEHLDLMDLLVYEASRRGIHMLLSPIVTYSSQWPDAMEDPAHGFSAHFSKSELGTDPSAIRAQVNYLQQLLNHVNPYTGNALKSEPSILFIEMINEPWHHSRDIPGSIRYMDALVGAVRSTGCRKLVFHNVSQDFNIAEAMSRSTIQGASFAWYPSGLLSGRTLHGNYLRTVDRYDLMKIPALEGMPRIVYEFDSPDLLSPVMYPAMVRTFRTVGTQFAAMFAYDMLVTASANLGWQTHYLNLVYTPEKAASAIIAAEAMRTLPRDQDYGPYPENTRFGPFRISYEEDLSEYVSDAEFMYTGTTATQPPDPGRLEHIMGRGNSPLVRYEGNGIYFLDKVREGIWRLELYPDAVQTRDPFDRISPEKRVSRLVFREHSMMVRLPDLGASFMVSLVSEPSSGSAGVPSSTNIAENGAFNVQPGIYTLARASLAGCFALPEMIRGIGYREYLVPQSLDLPVEVRHDPGRRYQRGQDIPLRALVVDEQPVDSVVLYIRTPGSWFRSVGMKAFSPYEYQAILQEESLTDPFHEYCITVYQDDLSTTFPEGTEGSPADWDFYSKEYWPLEVCSAIRPFPLFIAREDLEQLSYTRIGDHIRHGIFRLVEAGVPGTGALRLSLPSEQDRGLTDYTASLFIGDRISRLIGPDPGGSLTVTARGLHPGDEFFITLVESDGTAWTTRLELTGDWRELEIPLNEMHPGRGVMLPQGYPGNWNYWLDPTEGRGGASDRIRVEKIEQLQFSVRPGKSPHTDPGVEIASVSIISK
jgi:hypothetical protein